MTRKALPPYVYKKVAKGRTYYRFERGNISAVIDPNAPDFLAKYQALLDKKVLRAPKGRTFKALVADYKDGDSFKALAPRTKDDYCKVLDRILAKPGGEDPAAVRKVHVAERQRLGAESHDLRYRGVMELAFAGCTDEEIGSISGHESKAMIRKYAGDARQMMLAKSANKKRGA